MIHDAVLDVLRKSNGWSKAEKKEKPGAKSI